MDAMFYWAVMCSLLCAKDSNTFFLCRCRACWWKNLVLESPSLRWRRRDFCLAIVRSSNESPRSFLFNLCLSSIFAALRGLESMATSSLSIISRAIAIWRRTLPIHLELHACRCRAVDGPEFLVESQVWIITQMCRSQSNKKHKKKN